MVKTLHSAGIEVILDVVYNHTCEGNQLGPTLSMRGVDNASYYIAQRRATALLRRLHRLRQHGQPGAAARAAARDGFAALLGRGDARRRLPLRPRVGAGARGRQGREPRRLLRCDPAGPDAQPRQAHRRALGPGPGRLPGRQLPARLGRMERPLSRRHAQLVEGRRGRGGRCGAPAGRLAGSLRLVGQGAARQHQLHHRARWLHTCTTWSPTTRSTTKPTARTTATATTTTCRGTAAPKGPPTTPEINALRERQKRNFLATLLLSQGVPMLLAGDERGHTQQRQQQRLLPGQRAGLARLDALARSAMRCASFVAQLVRTRRSHPSFRRRSFFRGQPMLDGATQGRALAASPTAPRWRTPTGATHVRCLGMLFSGTGIIDVGARGEALRGRRFPAAAQCLSRSLALRAAGARRRAAGPAWSTRRAKHRSRCGHRAHLSAAGPLAGAAAPAACGHAMKHAPFDALRRRAARRRRRALPALGAGSQPQVTLEWLHGDDVAGRRPCSASAEGWHELTLLAKRAAGDRYRYLMPDGPARARPGIAPQPRRRARPERGGRSARLRMARRRLDRPALARSGGLRTARRHLHARGHASAAAQARLPELAALGITAVELMPLADFPGRRNWGYDGVLHFAPDASYGTPDDLKAFVDAAHGLGLMVLIDVVYNHFGPEGNYLHAYCPQFFNPAHQTPWGAAINFDGDAFAHRARLLRAQRALLGRGIPLRRPAHGRRPRHSRRLHAAASSRRSAPPCARGRAAIGRCTSCWRTTSTKPTGWSATRKAAHSPAPPNGTTTCTMRRTCC